MRSTLPRACRGEGTIRCYLDLPLEAPQGIEDEWKAYKATVKLVGIHNAARPYPEHSFWTKLVQTPNDGDNKLAKEKERAAAEFFRFGFKHFPVPPDQ